MDVSSIIPCGASLTPEGNVTQKIQIETFTGKNISLTDPNPADFDIVDIAHHLSLQSRFCGATKHRWTVAQHTLLCFKELYHNHQAAIKDSLHLELALLLHDAHEYIYHDLTSHLKLLVGPIYNPLIERFDALLQERFEYTVDEVDRRVIKCIDLTVLKAEAIMLIHSQGKDWYWPDFVPDSVTHLLPYIYEEPDKKVEEKFLTTLRSCVD